MSLRVGIVGLSAGGGWAGRAHVPAIEAVPGLELAALATSSPASARAASEAFGVPGFASVDTLVAGAELDLVVVSVKVPRHRELVLPALAAGVPVLSEWPLAVSLAEAEELAAAAGAVRTFVGLQGRAVPALRRMAALVAEGFVGEVLSATVVAATAGWGATTSERGRYLLDRTQGATMLTIGLGHAIDSVAMVVGELEDVVATTATRRPLVRHEENGELVPMTAEDQIALSGTVAGGAVLAVHYRGGTAAGPGFSLVVDGTAGTLEATAPSHPGITPVTLRGVREGAPLAPLDVPGDRFPALAGTHVHALAHAYADVEHDLRAGSSIAPGFAHAVRRHRLLDAIVRSAETGRRIDLA